MNFLLTRHGDSDTTINTGDIHTTGIGTNESISILGKTKFTDVLSGGGTGGSSSFDTDILALTDKDDVFFLHDTFSSISGNVPTVKDFMGRDVAQRVLDIEEVLGGAGNDIIDMSSPDLALQNFIGLMIDGGVGNDVIGLLYPMISSKVAMVMIKYLVEKATM